MSILSAPESRSKAQSVLTPAREHFIPKGSIKITPKGVEATVYLYDSGGQPCAMAFGGKRNKPDLHVRYRSVERREKAVAEYIENLRRVATHKAEQKAARANFKHSFKVGDIFHNSWGYDQTQCEFYEVTATTTGTVTIREIAQETEPGSEGFMCDRRLPLPGQFLSNSQPMTKRPQFGGYVPMEHGHCSLWDGRSKHCSWYA